MRKFVIYVICVSLLAFIFQWVFIRYIPALIYKIAVHRSAKPVNQWVQSGKTDAGMRRVVLPNPDFIYSALFYDLSENDIEVSGILPDSSYASVAFYDDRCQPYYVYNNLDKARTGAFHLKLSGRGNNDIQAKTNKGVIICRFLVKNDNAFRKMKIYQAQLACKVE